jgi:hypothetical protein
MNSNYGFTGVRVAGVTWTSPAVMGAHPAFAAAAIPAPHKRRAAAGTTAESVGATAR